MEITEEKLMEMLPSMRRERLIDPAELRTFFKVERKVQIKALAKALDVTAQAITNYFSGHSTISQAKERKLLELRDHILAWEEANGRMWGE